MILPAIPDRVSIDPKSPHYWPDANKLNVRFEGKLYTDDVIEFCVSGNWVRIHVTGPNGKKKFERGRPVAFQRYGKVEPVYKEQADV